MPEVLTFFLISVLVAVHLFFNIVLNSCISFSNGKAHQKGIGPNRTDVIREMINVVDIVNYKL